LDANKMKIAVVSTFYSEGMGYTENCLPKALANLGHDVHVVTSTYNVYGNSSEYDRTYRRFLGPPIVGAGRVSVDGYQVHRLEATLLSGYVRLKALSRKIAEISPDVVHSLEIASLQTFELALQKPFADWDLFCETHQHLSVVRPFLSVRGSWARKTAYRLTRTLPTWLASLSVKRCYAISPDCAEVASRFYGVPRSKVVVMSLGADTDLFHPVESAAEMAQRRSLRQSLGFADDDIVCAYTGRFSADKNPLALASAVDVLSRRDGRFRALFIGEGVQRDAIAACRNTVILPFMTHRALAEHYRACDLAVWPTQESMSMLDAASSGLPLVVSDRIGEVERVTGNGTTYREPSVDSLSEALSSLSDGELRRAYGTTGRRKMLEGFSWARYARAVEADYQAARTGR
jgi:glycosyltransferase involved in cell wall biosynthesis